MAEREKKIKLWKQILKIRSTGLSLAQVGRIVGVTRQRVHQIKNQAIEYAGSHDDELAKWIRENTK